jgi:hypothetical protein
MLDGKSYPVLSDNSFTRTSVGSHEYTFFLLEMQNRPLLKFVQLKFVLLGELFTRQNTVEIRQI